ncbi:uncharacterized protein LOC110378481 isoform X2 [Helicoverpa armigera]|uniref:uncharacterized protein LOC110378481 isoform X2 n=1 Tax=Helicoverpa armigera TaxID=29058 RepID=UPI003082D191
MPSQAQALLDNLVPQTAQVPTYSLHLLLHAAQVPCLLRRRRCWTTWCRRLRRYPHTHSICCCTPHRCHAFSGAGAAGQPGAADCAGTHILTPSAAARRTGAMPSQAQALLDNLVPQTAQVPTYSLHLLLHAAQVPCLLRRRRCWTTWCRRLRRYPHTHSICCCTPHRCHAFSGAGAAGQPGAADCAGTHILTPSAAARRTGAMPSQAQALLDNLVPQTAQVPTYSLHLLLHAAQVPCLLRRRRCWTTWCRRLRRYPHTHSICCCTPHRCHAFSGAGAAGQPGAADCAGTHILTPSAAARRTGAMPSQAQALLDNLVPQTAQVPTYSLHLLLHAAQVPCLLRRRRCWTTWCRRLRRYPHTHSICCCTPHRCHAFSGAGAAGQPGAADCAGTHILTPSAAARRTGAMPSQAQALLDNLVPQTAQNMYTNGTARHSRQDSPDYLTLNTQIEEARAASQELDARRSSLAEKLARKQRRRDKKRKKLQRERGDALDEHDAEDMAEAVEATAAPEELARAGPSAGALDADERRQEELRKRARDPPIVFSDIDGVQEYEKLAAALAGAQLSPEERQSLDELQQYLVHGEGSWVLGDDFLAFVGRLLGWAEAGVRVAALRCLAAAALREDVSLLLHQDRRHHALLNYAHAVDALSLPEQQALALFLCNLFENISSSEWLLYISEWEHNGQPLSNIRATTKVTVHACLSADPELRDVGTALMYNIATKEVKTVVFDEVCVELAMALLQLLQWAPGEEQLWRACRALARFVAHSPDVPQLVAMVGPDPAAFRGTSPRVDEQIELIMKHVK